MSEEKTPLPPDKIREMHIQKHGLQISKTLLDIHESFNELESDPGLWELLIRDLAGPDIVDVNEVLEVNENMRSQVGEGEIYGVILLYLVDDRDRNQRSYNKELGSKFEKDEAVVNSMFFPLQKVPNACATYAALSILLNSPSLPLGSLLQEFKEFTQGMSPEAKGLAVGNSAAIAAYHNRRAPVTSSYASYVNSKPPPSRTGSRYVIRQTQQFHFVPYVLVNEDLMELDGLREFPISHGPVSPGEDWTEKCRKVIGERMKKSTGLNYTLLVVKSCRRSQCIEDSAKIHHSLTQCTAAMIDSKQKLEETHCRVPEELDTLIDVLNGRTPLPSAPADVAVDLPAKTENVIGLCDFLVDLLGNRPEMAEGKISNGLDGKTTPPAPITPPATSFMVCKQEIVLRPIAEAFSSGEITTLSPNQKGGCKVRTRKWDPTPGVLSSPEPAVQYAPGYSLRSAGSSPYSTFPSVKVPRDPTKAQLVDANTDSMEECSALVARHLNFTPRGKYRVKDKNGRFASVKSLLNGKSPESESAGSSAASSRAESVVSSGTPEGATPTLADGVRTRQAVRSSSRSTADRYALDQVSLFTPPNYTQKELRFRVKQEPEGEEPPGGGGRMNGIKLKFVKEHPVHTPTAVWGLGQADLVGKKLEDTRKVVEKGSGEKMALVAILAEMEKIRALELQRVKLYEGIVEENARRAAIESDAEERECDHDAWITVLLKRTLELEGLVTQDELEALIPADVRRRELKGSPDSDSSARTPTTTSKRPINGKRPSSDTGSVLKSKYRKTRP